VTRGSASRSDRAYALLLLAYPRSYRRRFGTDQRELFRDLHRCTLAKGSVPAMARLWLRQLIDVARTAPTERVADLRRRAGTVIHPRTDRTPSRPRTTGDGMFARLTQDLAFAARMLRKAPLFTATAVVVIALGTGAVTTIYSAANAILLRPVPGVRAAGSLVEIVRTRGDGQGTLSPSYPYARELRDDVRALSGVVAWSSVQLSVGVGDTHVMAAGNLVTANYFDVLGVRPELGRFFVPAEDSGAGAHPVAVVSHGFWQRELGGDPNVVGRAVNVNGIPLTVVGVAPASFDGTVPLIRMDAWIPMIMQPGLRREENLLDNANAGWLQLFGRLAPGVSQAAAQAEVAAITNRIATGGRERAQFQKFNGARLHPLSAVPHEVHTAVLGFFGLLLAISMLVLLIASVDVAGMLLARGINRRREMAVRAALGAGRRRLMAQLLTETLLLYGLGAAGGVALAYWGARLLERVPVPADVPLVLHLAPDGRVLAFALGIALVTGLVFGLAPALRSTRSDLATGLRGDTAGAGASRSRARSALVVGQMALSLLLLVAAGLFGRALERGQRVDPGIDVNGVETADVNVQVAGYDSVSGARVYARLKQGMLSVPGVTSVSYARLLPLSMNSMSYGVRIDGYTPPAGGENDGNVSLDVNIVDPDYFATVRMPLLRGRDFVGSDDAGAPRVAIVNQRFVNQYWPGQEPIGRTFRLDRVPYTVVGVARDAKYGTLNEEPKPFAFIATAQNLGTDRVLVVRTSGDPAALASAIRREARLAGPDLPPPQATTLAAVTSIVLLPQRVAAAVTGALGIVGLLLAAVGLYGVIAYSMSQRTREIGIRMALGADRRSVLTLVLGEGLRLVGVGIGVGVVLAVGVTRFMRPFLFGVSPVDPLTFASIALGLAAIAVLASYVPARRAAGADPALVLRQD
jgi:putative ABC transport system permease protein